MGTSIKHGEQQTIAALDAGLSIDDQAHSSVIMGIIDVCVLCSSIVYFTCDTVFWNGGCSFE